MQLSAVRKLAILSEFHETKNIYKKTLIILIKVLASVVHILQKIILMKDSFGMCFVCVFVKIFTRHTLKPCKVRSFVIFLLNNSEFYITV